MKSFYSLEIRCKNTLQFKMVSEILQLKSTNKDLAPWWILEVEERDEDSYFDFIMNFFKY